MKIKLNTLDDANRLAQICGTFEEDIDAIVGRYVIDAKSYLGILSVGFSNNIEIVFHSNNIKLIERFYDKLKEWVVNDE